MQNPESNVTKVAGPECCSRLTALVGFDYQGTSVNWQKAGASKVQACQIFATTDTELLQVEDHIDSSPIHISDIIFWGTQHKFTVEFHSPSACLGQKPIR